MSLLRSTSGNENLEVLSVRFKGCWLIYPLAVEKTAKKYQPEIHTKLLPTLIVEAQVLNIVIDVFVADAPKRASLRQVAGCVSNRYPSHPVLARPITISFP